MGDEEAPDEDDDAKATSDDDGEGEAVDPNLFGIDLGRRGDRVEQTSRDEVEVEPVKKERAAARTLSDRLASAASDRDDANRASDEDSASKDE